jgi:mono/diheme cytochrome c family protein
MKGYVLMVAPLAIALLMTAATKDRHRSDGDLSRDAARGKYLVQIAGCNDCHTPDYAMTGGKVEEKDWLTGDHVGWRGPWGTTYPPNLRLVAQGMTADEFMRHARSPERRPPMPWFNVRDMSDEDVKAIYAYLKHLGPGGTPAPAYVPPDRDPRGPVIRFPAE